MLSCNVGHTECSAINRYFDFLNIRCSLCRIRLFTAITVTFVWVGGGQSSLDIERLKLCSAASTNADRPYFVMSRHPPGGATDNSCERGSLVPVNVFHVCSFPLFGLIPCLKLRVFIVTWATFTQTNVAIDFLFATTLFICRFVIRHLCDGGQLWAKNVGLEF